MAGGKSIHVTLAADAALEARDPWQITIVDPKGGSEFGALAQMEGDRFWPENDAPTDAQVWSQDSAALLDQAADWIEAHGWVQGRFAVGDRCCVHAAIIRTCESHEVTRRQAAAEALYRWLVDTDAVDYYSGMSIAGWNDQAGMTQNIVVAGLRSAAVYTREKARAWTDR